MKTMIHRHTIAIAFGIAILFASGLILQAQEEVLDEQEPVRVADMKLTEFEHTPWEDTTITLLNPKDRTTSEITARSTTYRLAGGFSCRVTVFQSASGELFWIGPERDFYIELETGISGGLFSIFGRIYWCQSMVPKPTSASATLDSVILAFEKEADMKTLLDSMLHHRLKSQEEQIWNITDLKQTFGRETGAFGDAPNSNTFPVEEMNFETDFEGGEIKVTIENPVSSFQGEVWIDPTTRKVTKSAQLSLVHER